MSTYTALIRFAPLTTLERVNSPAWKGKGRTMYDPGAIKFLPGQTSVPLIIDHDAERVIGTVHTITRWDDETGPWQAALAMIHNRPGWLRKNETRVSFGYKPAGTSHDVFGCEISRRGYITEVSVLSPTRTPAEPLAKVLTIRRDEPKPVVQATREWKTTSEQRVADLGARGIICRPGLGQVLAVR